MFINTFFFPRIQKKKKRKTKISLQGWSRKPRKLFLLDPDAEREGRRRPRGQRRCSCVLAAATDGEVKPEETDSISGNLCKCAQRGGGRGGGEEGRGSDYDEVGGDK